MLTLWTWMTMMKRENILLPKLNLYQHNQMAVAHTKFQILVADTYASILIWTRMGRV